MRGPSREPVLLPADEAPHRPLPGWLAPVAVVGLAVLAWSTVPAMLRHGRLLRDHERLLRETGRQEEELRRLQRDLVSVARDRFLREHALRRLLRAPATDAPGGAGS